MTLDHKKIEIIREIAASTQEEFINAVDEVIKKFTTPTFKLNLGKHTNIKPFVDLEKIKREQPTVDFEMDKFIADANNLEWDKSIDELLADL